MKFRYCWCSQNFVYRWWTSNKRHFVKHSKVYGIILSTSRQQQHSLFSFGRNSNIIFSNRIIWVQCRPTIHVIVSLVYR